VALIYESARIALPAALTSLSPQAPEVQDISPVESYWQLFVPEEYEVTRTSGNMKEVAASVMTGGKLNNNIDEVKRLIDFADNSGSSYQRRTALRNLARKQQEFNDNYTVLQNTGQNKDALELRRIGRDDLESQLSGNNEVQQKASEWAGKLNAHQKQIEEAVAGGADAEQQRDFEDNYNFLNAQWRSGSRYKKSAESSPAAQGDVPLGVLLERHPLTGFRDKELLPPPVAHPDNLQNPLPLDAGLREDAENQINLQKSASDLRVPERGVKLTFHRANDGQPELSIRLRSRNASWQFASASVLGALALCVWIVRRRESKPAIEHI